MTSKILLYIITRNKQTMDYEVLSIDPESIKPPTLDVVANIDIQDQYQTLYNQYIINYSNINNIFTFLNIDVTETIDIIYFCFVPFGTKHQNSYFIPIKQNEIFTKHIRQIINVA